MDLVGAIAIPLLILYARGEISHHRMTEGQFFAFLYAMFNTYMPVKRIGYVYQQLQAVRGASAQISLISIARKRSTISRAPCRWRRSRTKSNLRMWVSPTTAIPRPCWMAFV